MINPFRFQQSVSNLIFRKANTVSFEDGKLFKSMLRKDDHKPYHHIKYLSTKERAFRPALPISLSLHLTLISREGEVFISSPVPR